MPNISILIPCYNHQQYVAECVESIWNQNYRDVEIIAIDDGSRDNSWEILIDLSKRSPVPMIISRHANMGAPRTLNRALAKASGAYVCVIASDDVYRPGVFEQYASVLDGNPIIKAIYANGRYMSEGGISSDRVHPDRIVSRLKQSSREVLDYLLEYVPRPLLNQCAIYDREMLTSFEGWDEELLLDDWPLNIRVFNYIVSNRFAHYYLDLDVVNYRMHGANLSKSEAKMHAAVNEVIDKYVPLDRHHRILINEQWADCVGMLRRKPISALLGMTKSFVANPDFENLKFLFDVVNRHIRSRRDA